MGSHIKCHVHVRKYAMQQTCWTFQFILKSGMFSLGGGLTMYYISVSACVVTEISEHLDLTFQMVPKIASTFTWQDYNWTAAMKAIVRAVHYEKPFTLFLSATFELFLYLLWFRKGMHGTQVFQKVTKTYDMIWGCYSVKEDEIKNQRARSDLIPTVHNK